MATDVKEEPKGMAEKMNLKLLVDKNTHTLLYAEGGKDFVDFLFSLMAMRMHAVTRVLKQVSSGCLGNIFESVEKLSDEYFLPNKGKTGKTELLQPSFMSSSSFQNMLLEDDLSPDPTIYTCLNTHYITTDTDTVCPNCGRKMWNQIAFANPEVTATEKDRKRGFVKDMLPYMITDDLAITPMSTISVLALLNKFKVKEVASLEVIVVEMGIEEGSKLLKASLESTTVLTDVFLGKEVAIIHVET